MESKNIFILALIASLIGGFAVGRFSAPTKVHEVTTEVIKQHEQQDIDKNTRTKIIETTRPDGSKERITEISQETKTDTTIQTSDRTAHETDKTYAGANWNIQALIGTGLPYTIPIYGLSANHKFIGPITLGLWGMTDKTVGISVGITF